MKAILSASKICIISLLILPHSIFSQTANIFDPGVPLIWLGLDFSKAGLVGVGQPKDYPEMITYWNKVLSEDYEKFNVQRFFKRESVSIDFSYTDMKNQNLNFASLQKSEAGAGWSTSNIQEIVNDYDFESRPLLGLMFIVESFNNRSEKSIIWITFVNMATREVIFTNRRVNAAFGSTARGFWANSVLDLLTHITKNELADWSKGNFIITYPSPKPNRQQNAVANNGSSNLNSNNNGPKINNDDRLKVIPSLIDEAVKNGDYQRAADLKAEMGIRQEIKTAITSGDYNRAAELNKKLGNIGSQDNASKIEEEIQRAVKEGDYAKAAELKKKLEGGNNSVANTVESMGNSSISFPTPEYLNQVCYLNESDNNLIYLEEAKPELKTSTWAAPGYAQSSSSYVMKGEHSYVILKREDPLVFVLKFPSGIDPKDHFRLIRFEIRGKSAKDRYAEAFVATGGFGGGSSGKSSKQDVKISFSKVADGVYKITPAIRLEAGEYAFDHLSQKMFAFQIR